MKVSFKGDYATKIVLDLAMNYQKGLSQVKDIAKRQDIPERFLEQIITILKNTRYVNTIRGPKGGVFLAQKPSQITLGEIVRLVDGTTAPIGCVSKTCYSKCDFEAKCALRFVWQEVREKTNEIVDNITFQDLVDKTKILYANSNNSQVDYTI